MKLSFLPEPELEFGDDGRHVDIRFGLARYGPLDCASDTAPKKIRIGIVGTAENTEQLRTWLDRCREIIPAKRSRQPNLFPAFPGFNQEVAFRSSLIIGDQTCRAVSPQIFDRIVSSSHDSAVQEAVDLFVSEFESLAEKHTADILVCAVPAQLAGLRDAEWRPGVTRYDFHDMLKARAMRLKVPVQLVLQQTYDPSFRKKQKIRNTKLKTQQDEATRAWNFHTALYYKANGYPWRLARESNQLLTCFIGISFYRTLDKTRLMTSMAQVFDERGDGLIVRGDPVRLTKEDRVPHLDVAGANRLLTDALKRYRDEHKTWPARVVLHKTSVFNEHEWDGFQSAVRQIGISHIDAISVSDGGPIRLFRTGAYPPLRGTLMSHDSKTHSLYLRGSVDFFQTYPGQYIPNPMLFRCDHTEQTATFLAREMLALSKMNWNDTQFDGGSPITIGAARKVADILKYVDDGSPMAHRYSHYM